MKLTLSPHLFRHCASLLPMLLQGLLWPWAHARLIRMAPLPQQANILALGISSSASLAAFTKNTHPASLNVITSSLTQIPIPAHSVDVIFCTNTLHNHPEWRRIITEATRLLRHGGLFYILETHTPTFTRAALRADLTHHGFTPLGTSPQPTNRLKRWLASHFTLTATRLTITQPEYD